MPAAVNCSQKGIRSRILNSHRHPIGQLRYAIDGHYTELDSPELFLGIKVDHDPVTILGFLSQTHHKLSLNLSFLIIVLKP